MIRRITPKWLKLFLRIFTNRIQDLIAGKRYNLAQKRVLVIDYTEKIELTQDLKPNAAKIINLNIASQAIGAVHILPNEVFSFWNAVGRPTKRNGYKKSRSIVNNKVTGSIGGGLCQLSGLIYYMALITDLEIIERHNHSMDIYNEKTRYYPLGADATVVYGYKDLKIRNNHTRPINFKFVLGENTLTLELNCFERKQKLDVKFEIVKQTDTEVELITIVNDEIKDKSIYKKPTSIKV